MPVSVLLEGYLLHRYSVLQIIIQRIYPRGDTSIPPQCQVASEARGHSPTGTAASLSITNLLAHWPI